MTSILPYYILLDNMLKKCLEISKSLFWGFLLLLILISSNAYSIEKLPVWRPTDIALFGAFEIDDTTEGTRVTRLFLGGEECQMTHPLLYDNEIIPCQEIIDNNDDVDIGDLVIELVHKPTILTSPRTIQLPINGEVRENWLTTYIAPVKGDAVCVESFLRGSRHIKYGIIYEGSYYDGSGTDGGTYYGVSNRGLRSPFYDYARDLPYHCIPLPRPKKREIGLQWNNSFISPVCFGEDPPGSRFNISTIRGFDLTEFAMKSVLTRGGVVGPAISEIVQSYDPEVKNMSITGKVATCFEDTMLGLFDSANGTSFFDGVRTRADRLIFALLTLYVVLQGFILITKGSNTLGFANIMMMFLKPVIVIYFTIGPGMATLAKPMMDISKSLALVVVDSSRVITEASVIGYNETQEVLVSEMESAKIAYMTAIAEYESIKAQDPLGNYDLSNTRDIESSDVVTAKIALEQAKTEFMRAESKIHRRGYNYCNFDRVQPPYQEKYQYAKLWDVIDCKLSKYIGIGDNRFDPFSPHLLKVASALFFVPFILILTIVFIIFVVLITLRIVAVYINSVISISILVFVSPIIIPLVLFDFTKYIFETWARLLIGFIVQPVIMFTFLTILFAAYDLAMFGGNHYFVPFNSVQDSVNDFSNKMCMSIEGTNLLSYEAVCTQEDFENTHFSDLTCDDESAVGCIVALGVIKLQELNVFPILGVSYIWSFPVFFAHSAGALGDLFIGMLKLNLISFIGYIMLNNTEDMAVTITNAFSMSPGRIAPKASPNKLFGVGRESQKSVATDLYDKSIARK